jgi:hypothetical protein
LQRIHSNYEPDHSGIETKQQADRSYRVRDELLRRTRESEKKDPKSLRMLCSPALRQSLLHEATVRDNGRSLPSPFMNQIVTRPDPFRVTTGQRQLAAPGIER